MLGNPMLKGAIDLAGLGLCELPKTKRASVNRQPLHFV
jgi:hypothetical protein